MLSNRSSRHNSIANVDSLKPVAGVSASERERARRWIVQIAFVVYWLLIFEGVLRKWAFPSLQKILFFIRDPFVLTVYVLAFRYRLWPRLNGPFVVGLAAGVAFLPLALIQSLVLDVSPLIVAYGWRNYFFYLPFAFLMGEHFRGKDLARLVRQTLIVSVPVAVLCYKQFSSPADDVLNRSYGQTATAMLVSHGVVRTSGTFTVSAVQSLYIGSIFAMLLCVWILKKNQRPLKPIWLWVASAAAITLLAVSGARSSFATVFPILVAGFASVFLLQRKKVDWRRVLIVPALVTVAIVGYLTVFHYAFEVMSERVADARQTEGGLVTRLTNPFKSIFDLWPRLSVLGTGIGTGTNAGFSLRTGRMGFTVEDEMGRVILETGIFGVLYIAYRYWLAGWLVVGAFKATVKSHNPLPLLLVAFESTILLVGQMTMQGTINGFGFLFAGFCIAANRLGSRVSKDPAKRGIDPWL